MSKQEIMTIIKHQELIDSVYEMVLQGDTSAIKSPGQFINIALNDGRYYLRRPMSICAYDNETITLIYKVVGVGTKAMSQLEVGEKLDVLVGLGHGFDSSKGENVLVIGGGLGVPPLYQLTKELIQKGVNVTAILGFASQKDIFYQKEFEDLTQTYISSMDGSFGIQGTVIDVIKEKKLTYDHYYACGPIPMLEALVKFDNLNGSLSYEARMGCGFGACMGCSMLLKNGESQRVCVEGPVFSSNEVMIHG